MALSAAAVHDADMMWHASSLPMTVGETEIQRKGPAGVTTTTEVMQGDLQEYQKLKAEKQIYREEVQDGTLYYAVAVNRDLPFPGGVSAWVAEIQRYKVPAPKTP